MHCINTLTGQIAERPEASAPWVPYVEDDVPQPGPDEMVVDGPVIIEANQARKTWLVVPLTEAQLEERAERAHIEQILATADDMIAGNGTAGERQRRVELAMGRLLKRLVKKGLLP